MDALLKSFLEALIYGLQAGMTYVLVALGLTLIYSILNVMNIAHGEFYMLGGFGVFFLCGLLHINYIVALLISMVAVGLIGLIVERVVFRPAHGDLITCVIIATGLMWILETTAQLLFGRLPRGMSEVLPGSVAFLNINISSSRIIAAVISVILVVGAYFFVYRTKYGRAMQAIGQDREAAALQGVDIDKMGALGFSLSCALAAAAGGVMAPVLFVEATMGLSILLKSICIIILGGIGSIPGVAVAGLILGLVESYGQVFLGYGSSTFPFIIIILVLLFKRSGLMGRMA